MSTTAHTSSITMHTPAPWSYKAYRTNRSHTETPNGFHVFDGDYRLVADVQYEANARLIVAAPALLKALQLILDLLPTGTEPWEINSQELAAREIARAAIAQAKGDAQ